MYDIIAQRKKKIIFLSPYVSIMPKDQYQLAYLQSTILQAN